MDIKYNTMENVTKEISSDTININMFGNLIIRGDNNFINIVPENELYLNLIVVGDSNYIVYRGSGEFILNLVVEGKENKISIANANLKILGDNNSIKSSYSSLYIEGRHNKIELVQESNIKMGGNNEIFTSYDTNILVTNHHIFKNNSAVSIKETYECNVIITYDIDSIVGVLRNSNIHSKSYFTADNIFSSNISSFSLGFETKNMQYSNIFSNLKMSKVNNSYNNNYCFVINNIERNDGEIKVSKNDNMMFSKINYEATLKIGYSEMSVINCQAGEENKIDNMNIVFDSAIQTYIINTNKIYEVTDKWYKITDNTLLSEKSDPEMFI